MLQERTWCDTHFTTMLPEDVAERWPASIARAEAVERTALSELEAATTPVKVRGSELRLGG